MCSNPVIFIGEPTHFHVLGYNPPHFAMIPDERVLRDDGGGPPVFEAGQIVSERYRILRFINRGGMGEVYAADDLELHERVALKTLLPEIAGDARCISNFKREIQLSRKVTHPNVCKVFDLVLHSGNDPRSRVVYFLTMHPLSGEPLNAPLPPNYPIRP